MKRGDKNLMQQIHKVMSRFKRGAIMKKENLICPFCKSQIDELSRDKLELMRSVIFSEMSPALFHTLKTPMHALFTYIMTLKRYKKKDLLIINEEYLPKFTNRIARLEELLKEINTYLRSMMDFSQLSYGERGADPVKRLPDKINSILKIYGCEVKMDYSSFEKKELFINIDDYIIVFALVLHDVLLLIRSDRHPKIDISFAFEKPNLKTIFKISNSSNTPHRDRYPFEKIRNFWDWPKYATKIVGGEISINEDNRKTIVIFDIPFVNKV